MGSFKSAATNDSALAVSTRRGSRRHVKMLRREDRGWEDVVVYRLRELMETSSDFGPAYMENSSEIPEGKDD